MADASLKGRIEVVGAQKAKRDLASVKREGQETEKSLKGVGKSAAGLKKAFMALGVGISAALVIRKVTSAFISATRTFMEFEQGMANVAAISGATEEQLKMLSDTALELAARTKFTPKEATEGLYALASAGLKAEEQVAALPGVLDFAASAAADLGQATETMVNALKVFNLDASQSGKVADVFTNAIANSSLNAQRLQVAMAAAGPAASALGFSLEETTAAVAILTSKFGQGEMAGTGFKTAMLQLGDKAAELGLVVQDTSGKMLPLSDILEQIEEKGISTTRVMNTLGVRAGPTMAALIATGAEAVREMEANLAKTGTTTETAAKQMDTLQGAITELKSAWDAAMVRSIDMTDEEMVEFIDSMKEIVNSIPETVKFLMTLKEAYEGISRTLVFSLNPALYANAEAMNSNRSAWTKWVTGSKLAQSVQERLSNVFLRGSREVALASDEASDYAESIEQIRENLDKVRKPYDDWIAAMDLATERMLAQEEAKDSMNETANAEIEVLRSIRAEYKAGTITAKDLADSYDTIEELVKKQIPLGSAYAQNLLNIAREAASITAELDSLTDGLGEVKDKVDPLTEAFEAVFGDEQVRKAEKFVDKVLDALGDLTFFEVFDPYEGIPGFTEMFDASLSELTRQYNELIKAQGGGADKMLQAFPLDFGQMGRELDALDRETEEAAKEVGKNFQDAIGDAAAQALRQAFLGGNTEQIAAAFASMLGDAIGRAVSQKLTEALSASMGAGAAGVAGAIGGAVVGALIGMAANELFNSESDRVVGAIVGLEASTQELASAARDLRDSLRSIHETTGGIFPFPGTMNIRERQGGQSYEVGFGQTVDSGPTDLEDDLNTEIKDIFDSVGGDLIESIVGVGATLDEAMDDFFRQWLDIIQEGLEAGKEVLKGWPEELLSVVMASNAQSLDELNQELGRAIEIWDAARGEMVGGIFAAFNEMAIALKDGLELGLDPDIVSGAVSSMLNDLVNSLFGEELLLSFVDVQSVVAEFSAGLERVGIVGKEAERALNLATRAAELYNEELTNDVLQRVVDVMREVPAQAEKAAKIQAQVDQARFLIETEMARIQLRALMQSGQIEKSLFRELRKGLNIARNWAQDISHFMNPGGGGAREEIKFPDTQDVRIVEDATDKTVTDQENEARKEAARRGYAGLVRALEGLGLNQFEEIVQGALNEIQAMRESLVSETWGDTETLLPEFIQKVMDEAFGELQAIMGSMTAVGSAKSQAEASRAAFDEMEEALRMLEEAGYDTGTAIEDLKDELAQAKYEMDVALGSRLLSFFEGTEMHQEKILEYKRKEKLLELDILRVQLQAWELWDEWADLWQDAVDAVNDGLLDVTNSVSALQSALEAFDRYRSGLGAGPGASESQQFFAARARFNQLAALAMGGDSSVLGDLTSAHSAMVNQMGGLSQGMASSLFSQSVAMLDRIRAMFGEDDGSGSSPASQTAQNTQQTVDALTTLNANTVDQTDRLEAVLEEILEENRRMKGELRQIKSAIEVSNVA